MILRNLRSPVYRLRHMLDSISMGGPNIDAQGLESFVNSRDARKGAPEFRKPSTLNPKLLNSGNFEIGQEFNFLLVGVGKALG